MKKHNLIIATVSLTFMTAFMPSCSNDNKPQDEVAEYGVFDGIRSDMDNRNHYIIDSGSPGHVTAQGRPMRDRPARLHMRKNKWWSKSTNGVFFHNPGLPDEKGTRLNAGCVALFKR